MPRSLLFALVLISTLPLTGCFYSREIAHTRRDIEAATDADFDRDVVVNLGPLSLRTAGLIAGFVRDDDVQMARDYLREVRRVKVGVYSTESTFSLNGLDLPHLGRLDRRGWETVVKFREDDQAVWVLYRERRGQVRDLYVMVLDDESLVLARLKGRFNRLVDRVVRDHTFLTHMLDDEP